MAGLRRQATFLIWLLGLALWSSATAAAAPACTGTDLLAGMSAAERARLIDGAPYPTGNVWRATKDGAEVTLVGTYHLDDPRFAPMVATIVPVLAKAGTLLVEAGPAEQAKLKSAIAKDPGHMFILDGPTLPEQLPKDEWQALSQAMQARGIPAILAAKFQPWYVSLLLSVPPCAMAHLRDAQDGKGGGLDKQLMALAERDGVPISALESWDTPLKLFDALGSGDQVDMIHAALAMDDQGGDMFVTMVNAYFKGEHQLIWAFARSRAEAEPGADGAALTRELDQMQTLLLDGRNRAWVPVIEHAAAPGKPVVAAFGAAHLGGREGVLNLLHKAGWTITRLDG